MHFHDFFFGQQKNLSFTDPNMSRELVDVGFSFLNFCPPGFTKSHLGEFHNKWTPHTTYIYIHIYIYSFLYNHNIYVDISNWYLHNSNINNICIWYLKDVFMICTWYLSNSSIKRLGFAFCEIHPLSFSESLDSDANSDSSYIQPGRRRQSKFYSKFS